MGLRIWITSVRATFCALAVVYDYVRADRQYRYHRACLLVHLEQWKPCELRTRERDSIEKRADLIQNLDVT
jgi:hypothetical protein